MSNLDSATDNLNRLLAQAEEHLRAMRLGVEATVELTSERFLGFAKVGAAWILEVRYANGEPSMPLLKTSRETRILAAASLSTLAKALRRNHDEMAHEVAVATRMVERFLYPDDMKATDSVGAESQEKTR